VQWVNLNVGKNFRIGKVTFETLNMQSQRCCQLTIVPDPQHIVTGVREVHIPEIEGEEKAAQD
jgi:hypothetical protein